MIPYGRKPSSGEHVKVGISGIDDFVQPYLEDALGDALVNIPTEALAEKIQLDAYLASCNAVILMNAHPNESGTRDDRTALLSMRDAARPVLELSLIHI